MSGPLIAVIGASRANEFQRELAFKCGRLLAEAGAVVICGGGSGVMEAVCEGVAVAGGVSIGILPGKDRNDCNKFVSHAIPTGLNESRNAVIVQAAEAVIAIGGGAGTLSEIGFAARIGKPIFGLQTFQVTSPSGEAQFVQHVETPEEAVRLALSAITEEA